MIPALPPATGAIEPAAKAPAALDPADLTPQELIRAADTAYAAGDWAAAEARLGSLVDTYREVPELSETVRRARPLLALVRLRLKKFDADTLGLVNGCLTDERLEPAVADELAFWKGLCHWHGGAHAEARKALADYHSGAHLGRPPLPPAAQRLRTGRRAEALLLQASSLLQEGAAAEAAALLESQPTALRAQGLKEPAGRALVLRLQALLKAEQPAAALDLVRASQPHLEDISQRVAFFTLCLQLGNSLLEAGRLHEAISCLQRVPPRDHILAHQQAAHARLSRRLAGLKRLPGQETLSLQWEAVLKRIEQEIALFSRSESFDAALRFRIAAAYRDLGRPREAALVLEDMLGKLPTDPLLEKAALCLVQCWMQAGAWTRAIAAADTYLEKFRRADNPDVPLVRFLKASALQADHRPNDAELAFAAVHQLHPRHELAARSLFLEGICLLEQDLNREATDAFNEALARRPDDEIRDNCAYWSAMAASFDKRHDEARDRLRRYLDELRDRARHADEARYRIAFSTFGLAEYPEAVQQLTSFIDTHPGHSLTAEAGLLLGDALGALGRLDEAVAAYSRVDRGLNLRCFEEAVFRIANVYKQSERPELMRARLERFVADHPDSPRLAEAVHWIGQSHQRSGRLQEAQEAYWQVIKTRGNDASAAGVEDVVAALPKLYGGPQERETLSTRLGSLAAEAEPQRPTLALRARWGRARLLATTQPEQARAALVALRPSLDPRLHHPRILADCADALRESGQADQAQSLYRDLRKWHPRALEKDRAFLGLGLIAADAGQPEAALELLARFERETVDSPLRGQAAHLRATLCERRGDRREAQTEYERLLEIPNAPRQLKAQALLKLGDLMVAQNEDLKATAYYERVYVSFGKHRPESASAYARRARALERLNHQQAALEVWRELAGRPELAEFPEFAEARERLVREPPPAPAEPPAPSRPSPAPPDRRPS